MEDLLKWMGINEATIKINACTKKLEKKDVMKLGNSGLTSFQEIKRGIRQCTFT